MLQIVSDEQETRDCYGKLLAAFEKKASPSGRKSLELHGNRRMADVFEYRLPGHSRCLTLAVIKDKSAYNILAGFSDSKSTSPSRMDFHLSIPASGIERYHPCAFARDGAGRTYLVHRGLFFGGRYTFKRDFFFENYEGFTAYTDDGPARCRVVVVGELGRRDFLESFTYFLAEVDRIAATAPRSHQRRHRLDRKRRAENRATVKEAIVELNSKLGKVKVIDGHQFGLYQPRRSESATANLEFEFKGETLVFELTLRRDRIAVVLYPRAAKRGQRALDEFVRKGFAGKIDVISRGEIGYEYDGSSVWFEVPVKGGKGHKKKLFVEYADVTVRAIIKTLQKA